MSDNLQLNEGSGGKTTRTLQTSGGIDHPVSVQAFATTVSDGANVLTIPVAAALNDAVSNPTTAPGASCLLNYNGTNWSRVKGDTTNGLLVNLGSNNDVTLATLPDTSASDLAAINTAVTAVQSAVEGTLTVGSHAVTNAGTFAVQESGGALTALQLLDDAVATDASASPSKGFMVAGHDGTNARRVAVDSSGHPQVDVLSSALPSGAATESKQDTLIGHVDGVESSLGDAVTALQIIDDWDETNRAKVNLVVGQAGITAGAGAVGAATPRVTLASDDPAVALLGTIDTDTSGIATSTSTLAGAVSGTEMQVDVLTIPDLSNQASATVTGCDTLFDSDGDNAAAEVKSSAGSLYGIDVQNINTADAWLQLFDVANGSITVGTTPPKLSFRVPKGDGTDYGGVILLFDPPIAFATAINYACTTTATGNGDPSTGLIANLLYK